MDIKNFWDLNDNEKTIYIKNLWHTSSTTGGKKTGHTHAKNEMGPISYIIYKN